MMEACLFCYTGTESVVRQEVLEKYSCTVTQDFSGAQYVSVDSMDDVIRLTYSLQTVTDVVVTSGKSFLLEEKESDYTAALLKKATLLDRTWFSFLPSLFKEVPETVTFAVRISSAARDKTQVERAYGGMLYDILSELFPHSSLAVDLDTPDVLIQGKVIDGRMHIGLHWFQDSCGKRDYKVMNSYRSLPGPLASIPLFLFSNRPSVVAVSPIYTGEICIESALLLAQKNPHYFSQDLFWEKGSQYSLVRSREHLFSFSYDDKIERDHSFTVIGLDDNPRHIAQAEKNILLSQSAEYCTLYRSTLSELTTRPDGVILDGEYVEQDGYESTLQKRLRHAENILRTDAEAICVLRSHGNEVSSCAVEGFTFKRKICAQYGDEFLHYLVYLKT